MSSTIRSILKWLGYCCFALMSFIFFLYFTFPYERIRVVAEQHLGAIIGGKVMIDEIGPSPLTGVTAKLVTMQLAAKEKKTLPPALRPKAASKSADGKDGKKEEKPKALLLRFDEITIKVGVWALLDDAVETEFSVVGFGGTVDGSFRMSKKDGWSAGIDARSLLVAQLPYVGNALSIPLRGALSLKGTLAVPKGKWSKAEGDIEIGCEDCTLGDGKKKLKIPPMLKDGLPIPRIRLGKFGGKISIREGQATFENFGAQSADLDLKLAGRINLNKRLPYSNIVSYLTFRLSDTLKKRDPNLESIEMLMQSAKRGDGFVGISLTGLISRPRAVPTRTEPAGLLGLRKKKSSRQRIRPRRP
jgi:type II secretion system protein N